MISTRYRVATAFTLIAAGIVVAIIGYLGVSKETEVAFQLPYFASAGVGALMLLGFGGILLLNSQLETDSDRMEELPAHKSVSGFGNPRAEKLARDEIPLFLGLRARKVPAAA